MVHKEFKFDLYKTQFYGRYYTPSTLKAVIVLIHGMGEHSKRYEKNVIPQFLKHNYAVITYDQFGHGLTQGKRGHNPGFSYLLECIDVVILKAINFFGKHPLVLYGHSMGGNVVLNYVLRRKNHPFKAVIATSPFLKLAFKPPQWKLGIGKILAKLWPSITLSNEIDANAISRDIHEVECYQQDPLVHDKVSPNYSIALMKTGVWAIQHANWLNTPTLIMHGTADRLTSYKASVEFVNNSNGVATLELFDGGYHELHHDIIKNNVLKKLINWIDITIT